MLEAGKRKFAHDHPPFMAILGLLPPYELADVEAAYHDKALATHPDRGGDPADFIRLKQAYDQAVEYAKFNGSRRTWVAAQVEQYLQQEKVIAEVQRRGGRVEVERSDWMENLWGEGFALLAERLRHICVRDMPDGDKFLAFLAEHRTPYLVGLDVAGSRISREGLRCLGSYEIMHRLDVSGTGIDCPALLSLLTKLPSLHWLNVRKTRVGWWGRWRLRRASPRLQVVAEVSPAVMPGKIQQLF